jgi:demethylspheroidene O-methyltransferase
MPGSVLPRMHRDRAGGGIADRWFMLRNRLLASPVFQRWAASFPITRPIARRHAQDLFDLCAGFVYSQILGACVELRLFEYLRDGPRSLDWLALRLSLPVRSAERLLEAATALGLVERRPKDRFGLGQRGAALIANPGVVAMIEHHRLLYADLRDPVALLRGEVRNGALGQHWPYANGAKPTDLEPEAVAAYSDLMAASQPLVAAEVLAAYPLGRHRCLLDLGGGDGTFLIAAAAEAYSLRLMLFDLPAVADRARARIGVAGLTNRTAIAGGDFRTDVLPEGADIISLIRVIHDHDDQVALAILRSALHALPNGGTLLLAEPMAGTKGAEPVAAYFTFYLLAMGSGQPRRPEALAHLLRTAGFSRVRLLATSRPMLVQVIVATK